MSTAPLSWLEPPWRSGAPPLEAKQFPPTHFMASEPFPVWACVLPGVNQSARAPGADTCVRAARWAACLPQVYPIVDFPLPEISLASQRGIAEHSAALASRARVLQQVSGVGPGAVGTPGVRGQAGTPRGWPSGHIKEGTGCSLCWGVGGSRQGSEGASVRGRVGDRSPSLGRGLVRGTDLRLVWPEGRQQIIVGTPRLAGPLDILRD